MPDPLTIRPDPARWRDLLRHNTTPAAATFRQQLRLPTDRPIIMTGHQAEFWHPGILAKYLAADAAAAALHASPAWLVVDQDRADSTDLHYPTRDGRIATLTARAGAPVPQLPSPPDPAAAPGLAAIGDALARHADQPTLARRVSAAITDLLHPLLSQPGPPTVFATELSATSLFAQLVARMRDDPESCVRAYNAAAAAHPTSGIRPLVLDDVQYRYELPLWHLPPAGPRARVYAEMLDTVPTRELAPKALFMTGLVRLAGCDLFIHGTGGGGDGGHEGYDLVTEDWLSAWLSIPRADLAPIVTVTATLYLRTDAPPPPTHAQVARALWTAHHARHNPGSIGEAEADRRKRDLVAAIAADHGPERRRHYRQLHAFLDRYRGQRRDELAHLDRTAAAAAARASDPDLRTVRTWPFPLYPGRDLTDLRARIAAAFNP